MIDTKNIANWVYIVLAINVLLSVLIGGFFYLNIDLLSRLQTGLISDADFQSEAKYIENSIEQISSLVDVGLVLLLLVFGRWTYVTCKNVKQIAADVPVTPLSSIGWYFIPIANLWMPYRGIAYIYRVSAGGASWSEQKIPVVLPTWWALLVGTRLLWTILGIQSPSDARLDALSQYFWYFIYMIPLDVALYLAMAEVVRQIQGNWSSRQAFLSA